MQGILDSESGPLIAYYLAKNVDIVEKLNNLPTHKQLLELGKLEVKVNELYNKPQVKETSKKVVSSAPKPIDGVDSAVSARPVLTSDLDGLSYKEFAAKREAMLREKYQKR
jgi:hypothetical protein